MHRLAALLLFPLLFALLPLPAAAQEPSAATLTLVSQTPWNSPDLPELVLRVKAVNAGPEPLGDLSLGITLWGPALSRSAFEGSLVADPENAVAIDAETLPREGTLEPGAERVFELHFALDSPGISPDRSLVYPLKVDLRSGLTPLAVLRTPAIFLVKQPQTPLRLAWTFVLHEPIGFGPSGVFNGPDLELALEPGGRLYGELRALAALVDDPAMTLVNVVVSPTLLNQLVRMRDGYTVVDGGTTRQVPPGKGGAAAAAQALADLRKIAGDDGVELTALPYSAPRLPALAAGGLGRDLRVQLERGRSLVATVLGRPPVAGLLRPPDSSLDQTTLDALARLGADTLILDPTTVPPTPQPLGFASPATASLAASGTAVRAVVADPNVEALLSSPLVIQDPVKAAQAVLGELAAIWLEQPGVERGLAIALPEDFQAPGAFFGPFVRGVAGAPWLGNATATALADAFPAAGSSLLAPSADVFSRGYVEELRQTRRRLDTYRSMLVEQSEEPARMENELLFAEAGQFVGNEAAGAPFVDAVRSEVGGVFDAVRPDTGQVVTLTSSTGGAVPVRVTNGNEIPVRVIVKLVSPHLSTSDAGRVLDAGQTTTMSFDVTLNTTGRFPVDVQVVSPSGRLINQAQLVVRSTGFNRIAILITVGAAAVLLLLWARRFVPRRTS